MSASRVFAKDFIRQYDRHESEVQKISEAFLVRIGVLQRDYGLSLQSETQQTERREKDRRTKRRKGVRLYYPLEIEMALTSAWI